MDGKKQKAAVLVAPKQFNGIQKKPSEPRRDHRGPQTAIDLKSARAEIKKLHKESQTYFQIQTQKGRKS